MFLISLIFSWLIALAPQPDKGKVIVKISNIHSDKGNISISIFKSADGYPDKTELAYKKMVVPISGGRATAVFDDLPYGEYAIAFIHDENNNHKMDSNFIGIPKEGVGASNDAKGSFGPPKYGDARFVLKQSVLELSLKTTYL